MDPLPKVTEAVIRQHASSDSYQRGREYYEQGAVVRVVRRDQQLQAEVEGSQYEPYRVQITYDAGGIAQAICGCPYDWSMFGIRVKTGHSDTALDCFRIRCTICPTTDRLTLPGRASVI